MSLQHIFVYLLAAVIAVPLAKRLGLGSVLGYLLAGVVIGPSALKLTGDSKDVLHIAEFGVVMMLFLIGLELRPALLWRLRVPVLGLGGAQVACVGAAVTGIAMVSGLEWKPSLALGLILAMSSTAIVLQSLAERGQLKLQAGQACFAVLLFQDIAVIPILAVLPLLAADGGAAAAAGHAGAVAHLPAWGRALVTIGAVAVVVIAGRFLLRHLFRYVAATRLREVFTETTLLLVVGITLLMSAAGLSAALGAFVAGVVLADSEYRHQLEADIEPFKGLLLGLFFIAVGAGIDFGLIVNRPGLIASLVGGLILLKFILQFALGRAFGNDHGQSLLFGLALAQGGEFCFVLVNVAQESKVFGDVIGKPVNAAIALSMALTPLLLVMNDRLIQPRLHRKTPKTEREPDHIPETDNPVILAGFGRFGHIVGRLLMSNGVHCTVLENDPDQIELLGKFGLKTYYGDATRADLLHAAGATRARLFILTLADAEKTVAVVGMVRQEFPNLRILARAHSRQHAFELFRAGVDDVFRDTLGSALDLGVAALRKLGFRGVQAVRAARLFKEHDEAALRDMAEAKGDEDDAEYVSRIRQHMSNLEELLRSDERRRDPRSDDAWEIGTPKREE